MIIEVTEPTDYDQCMDDSRSCHYCGDAIAVVLVGDRPVPQFIPYWNVTHADDPEAVAFCEECVTWLEAVCDEHAEPARSIAASLEAENARLLEQIGFARRELSSAKCRCRPGADCNACAALNALDAALLGSRP